MPTFVSTFTFILKSLDFFSDCVTSFATFRSPLAAAVTVDFVVVDVVFVVVVLFVTCVDFWEIFRDIEEVLVFVIPYWDFFSLVFVLDSFGDSFLFASTSVVIICVILMLRIVCWVPSVASDCDVTDLSWRRWVTSGVVDRAELLDIVRLRNGKSGVADLSDLIFSLILCLASGVPDRDSDKDLPIFRSRDMVDCM